ncbi:MAG TPA: response regulator [Longimicrobiales bacterium]|nr:response regulator [Longimicrobiales bacterium]
MARAPLVLIVSEHEWASRSLDSILAPRGYGVLRAYNGRQALERAAGTNVDAVFIDHSLPDMDGEEVCRQLVEGELVSSAAPIILVTSGFATREQRLEAMRAGAWELIALPVDAEELLLRMDRFVRAKLEADRAQEEALIDAVTGLYSWEGVARRIREVAAAAERFDRPVACVVFAPDGEDPLDEAAERSFLSVVAEQLRGVTRRSDILGRIGPREFAIIAPDTPLEGARVLAERLKTGSSASRSSAPDLHERRRPTAGERASGPLGRAGVCAIANLKDSGLDPVEIVVQATLASRQDKTARLN